MKKSEGFVLLTVLLLMQIYALLGVGALEQVFLEQKLLSDQKLRNGLVNAAESHLRQLAATLGELSETCLISVLPATQLRVNPLSWWSASACAEKTTEYRFYYVVEDLGTDPCAQLREQPGQAVYYRITLLVTRTGDESQRVLLQTTVVRASSQAEHCDSQPHSVNLGPQSWHELI